MPNKPTDQEILDKAKQYLVSVGLSSNDVPRMTYDQKIVAFVRDVMQSSELDAARLAFIHSIYAMNDWQKEEVRKHIDAHGGSPTMEQFRSVLDAAMSAAIAQKQAKDGES